MSLTRVDPAVPGVEALPSLAALALPAPVVDLDTPVRDVERRFRDEVGLRGLVTRHHDRWQLLTRAAFDGVLSGPYGYGRALLERKQLVELLPLDTVVLPLGAPLTAAAEAALARQPQLTDLVVESPDGTLGIVPVSAVFAALADGYRRAALTDPLTGLPNRLALHGDVRSSTPSAVLYIDLDRFKEVNDTFGHRAGDALLVEFAARLRSCLRADDVVARVGGDEFVVLLAAADEVQACAVAERIVLTAAAPFVLDGRVVTIGASVGVALPDEERREQHLSAAEVLLRHADAAMYRAKGGGRGRWARLDAGGRDVGPPLARRLRDAVESGRLTLHYQPQLRLADDDVTEVEALCRWSEPDLGPVPPVVFIPLAEQIGLILPLGAWVLQEACRQARAWQSEGRPVRVSVNVSPRQLAQPGFVDLVARALEESGLPADRLRLEITESAALTDPSATTALLRELAGLGVRLCLDDFGTGHSSLSVLRTLPVDGLKIDKSFVDRIDTDADDAAVLGMVVGLAQRLRLHVVAEGVERESQLAVLRQLGCDAVQGFLLGRPLPAEQVLLPRAVLQPAG